MDVNSTSKFQDEVKESIREILGDIRLLEEVQVKKLIPDWISRRERYDLVIPSLRIIIECHGEQHYQISTFFGGPLAEAGVEFLRQKVRDSKKKRKAVENNWTYIEIRFKEFYRKKDGGTLYVRKKILDQD